MKGNRLVEIRVRETKKGLEYVYPSDSTKVEVAGCIPEVWHLARSPAVSTYCKGIGTGCQVTELQLYLCIA